MVLLLTNTYKFFGLQIKVMPEMCLLSIRYLSLIEMSKTILETYVSRTEGRHIIFVIIEYDCRQSKKDIFE